MSAFNAVPNERHGAMFPATFVDAAQLRLRLPLSPPAGGTTCKCGAAMDCHGDYILACRACMSSRVIAPHGVASTHTKANQKACGAKTGNRLLVHAYICTY